MEQYYVHSLQRLAIHALRTGDCDKYERMQKENDDCFTELFNRLKKETIRVFYHEDATHRVAYFRSMKEPGKIMKGYWWKKDGEYIPVSDSQYATVKDLLRDNPETGCYLKVLL